MIFIIWFFLWWWIGYLYIDWSKWQKGFLTAMIGSLGSFVLDTSGVGSGWFWYYTDPLLPRLWPNLLLNLSLYPIGAWIYIQRYPEKQGWWSRIRWILVGTVILMVVEYNLSSLHRMGYDHGWSGFVSIGANIFLLLFLRLFHLHVENRVCD